MTTLDPSIRFFIARQLRLEDSNNILARQNESAMTIGIKAYIPKYYERFMWVESSFF